MRKTRRAAIAAIAVIARRWRADLLRQSYRVAELRLLVSFGRPKFRVEPEVNGQLVSIAVKKARLCARAMSLAQLSAVELTAQADQARAALASATANRNNVYAGVRREQVESLKAAIAKASVPPRLREAQLTRTSTLARQSFTIPTVARPGRK